MASEASPSVQDQLLAKLRKQQEDFDGRYTRISFHGTRLPDGPAEDAEGAFGTYLNAVAQERGMPVAEVKNHIPPAESFDPEEIEKQLYEEALRARSVEGSPSGRGSVASKKMAAYIRQEALLRKLQAVQNQYDPDEDPYDKPVLNNRAS